MIGWTLFWEIAAQTTVAVIIVIILSVLIVNTIKSLRNRWES